MSFAEVLIKVLHFLLIVFILVTPFCGTEFMLSIHLIVIPMILLHWATNESICALTELEKWVSGKTDDDATFFGRLVGPVYKFRTRADETLFLWVLMIALWVMSFYKLKHNNFAYLRSEFDRFRSLWR